MNGKKLKLSDLEEKFDKIFLISDTHFLHNNIIKYANRPKEHNEIMFENWNNTVGDNDLIIHVGDITVGAYKYENGEEFIKKILGKLNGKKVLIRGNHDKKNDSYYNHYGFVVYDYIIIDGIYLINHYPPFEKNDPKYIKDKQVQYNKELMNEDGVKDCEFLIHGHQHGNKYPNHNKCFNVTVERINYKPIELQCVLEKLNFGNS